MFILYFIAMQPSSQSTECHIGYTDRTKLMLQCCVRLSSSIRDVLWLNGAS